MNHSCVLVLAAAAALAGCAAQTAAPVTSEPRPAPETAPQGQAPATASAQAPSPGVATLTGPGPYALDCDAPTSQTSGAMVVLPPGTVYISGFVRFLENRAYGTRNSSLSVGLEPSSPGKPGAQLMIVGSQSNFRAQISFIPTGAPFGAPPATGGGSSRGGQGGQGAGSPSFAQLNVPSHWVGFTLSVNKSGRASATIGGRPAPFTLKTEDVDRLSLSCIAAHALFGGVKVAQHAP